MRSVATISVANNYIRIFGFADGFEHTVLRKYCKMELTKYGQEPIPGTRQKRWVATHVFARTNNDRTEYRMPKTVLEPLLRLAVAQGFNRARIIIEEEPELEGAPALFSIKEKYKTPREEQNEWIDYKMADGPLKVNEAATGNGKGQPDSAKIKIPGGWTTMGKIKVGDTVTAWDGSPTKVTGVYPQGLKQVYRISFEDGRQTEVDETHLWEVYDTNAPLTSRYGKTGNQIRTPEEIEENRWRIINTEELIELSKKPERWKRLYVRLNKPEEGTDRKFKIDPYVMGVILGDGCTASNCVTITKPYQQMFDKVSRLLPDHLTVKWVDEKTFTVGYKDAKDRLSKTHLKDYLIDHDLMGKRSWEKVIPVEYLHGSRKQRLALLQGLLDTDGTVGAIGEMVKPNGKKIERKGGTISFSSSSEKLALGVQYLVRSLGGIAKLSTRIPHYTYKGMRLEGRTDYRLHIRHPEPETLFTLDHKKERANAGQYSSKLKLRFKGIEKRQVENTTCISIAHKDQLYVTDDFIVTHNTYMALYCMMLMQKRTIITIQPRYIPIWQKDLAEMFDITPKDILVWEYTDLPRLGELCKEGKIDPKIIILPTTRISTYMRTRRKNGNLPCLDEIFANINPGLRIIDEAHESFHEVTLSMLYGNVKKTFMLSATLKGDDPFLNKMYLAMAPKETRLKEAEPENYIDIIAYLYQMDLRKHRIQTMQGGTYNDIALEKSILKSKEATDFYFNLADDMYKRFYLDAKEEGTKCIFFFTLIEMSLLMKERFRAKYPGEDFDTFLGTLDKKTPKKYLEHENLITTPGSCGTGKDIPGAITCISFHTVFSIQRNKQMIGRLRNLRGKFGGRITPRFVFPVCVDIAKHGDCFHKRKLAFAAKQKSWKTLESGLALQ